MSLGLKQVPDEIKTAFEQWKLLTDLIHRSEAMLSVSVSRVERGCRLRGASQKTATGMRAAVMAKAAEYEAEAYTYLAVIPAYRKHFEAELEKVRNQIEGGIGNE